MSPEPCSDLSLAAGEPLHATATTATGWLLVEVPGTWPRDVSDEQALPPTTRAALDSWLSRAPGRRLLFVRRPGRVRPGLAAFLVRAEEATAEVRRLDLRAHDELATVDLDRDGDPVDGSLVLVCGHGTRDACCARRGTAAYGALAGALAEDALWLSSHQGGHRFAANVLVLPAGLQFGRVEPKDARLVVRRALEGRIDLARYRGRTWYEPAVQAAELAVRESAGLDGVDDLRLRAVEDEVVRFVTRDGAEHAAAVTRRDGPSIPASCGAEADRQTVLDARIVGRSSGHLRSR